MKLTSEWGDYDSEFVRRRYNRLASFFVFFEWLFLLPPGIRKKAVRRLELKASNRVLEIGCGTGRNLALLREAVGPEGQVIGVDISEGMLMRAEQLCVRKNWHNVTLIRSDAAHYTSSEPVDAVLFSLSYATMPHHREVLGHAWEQLRPGGILAIMDAKLPSGMLGKLSRPFRPLLVWILKRTVLGNPHIVIPQELRELAGEIEVEEISFGTYFICRARKL
ncbi:MAG: class I SAM-dependent methyltransferase [Acidobacteriota bacterium]